MISTTIEGVIDEKIKKTVITKKKWYRDIHDIVTRFLKESPRLLKSTYDISVVLIDEDRMRRLYATYKGKNRVTDVLSFFYGEAEGESRPQGEVFICLPQALRQASRYHISPIHEIARLVIHGFLHIYGYDHQKKQQRTVMRSCERIIFRLCKKENLC